MADLFNEIEDFNLRSLEIIVNLNFRTEAKQQLKNENLKRLPERIVLEDGRAFNVVLRDLSHCDTDVEHGGRIKKNISHQGNE